MPMLTSLYKSGSEQVINPGRHRQVVLYEEGEMQRQPADGEHGDDDDHHARHSSLGQHRLTASCRYS